MPVVDTQTLIEGSPHPENLQVYCGLDSMLTREVHDEISRLRPGPNLIYDFERALQAPALEMMLRGWRIDEIERRNAIEDLNRDIAKLSAQLGRLAVAVWDAPLNPNSQKQLQRFFYSAMGLPEAFTFKRGERKLSMNRETLEKLCVYFHAQPIILHILKIRDLEKQRQVLSTEIDSDGRFRQSYNIAGTETGRPSSSANAFGTGGNAMNIERRLRRVFVADPGWKILAIDFEQSEARDIGWWCWVLFGDSTYLDHCESYDLHTSTARLVWPGLPWSKDKAANRALAEQPYYRHFSYRDMAKRGGHACLTLDHEVLTREGWQSIGNKPNEILCWSEDKSEFMPVAHWTDMLYTGKLHYFEGNSLSACMTHNHRVPYLSNQKQGYKVRTRLAEDGPGIFMPLGDNYIGGTEVVPARLIAAFMSDGSQKSVGVMEFNLVKERKILRLIELCKEAGFRCYRTAYKWCVEGNLPKKAGAFMLNWTPACLDAFLNEYKYWDGHISNTAVSLFSADREHLDWIKTLGRIRGIGGNIRQDAISGFGYTTYRLQQNARRYASGSSVRWTKVPVLDVRVVCPKVPTSWFYVRRNGKIFITGNCNYLVTPPTMARHLKIEQKLAEDFQKRYFGAYAALPRFHRWVAEQIQTKGHLVTPFGRRRDFFGRPNDEATLREAVAYCGQSPTADRTSLVLWRMWQAMPHVQLLHEVYDAVYLQYRPEDEGKVVAQATALAKVTLEHKGRRFSVPCDVKVGWNWGDYHKHDERCASACAERENLDGLKKWKGLDDRKRSEGLARVL